MKRLLPAAGWLAVGLAWGSPALSKPSVRCLDAHAEVSAGLQASLDIRWKDRLLRGEELSVEHDVELYLKQGERYAGGVSLTGSLAWEPARRRIEWRAAGMTLAVGRAESLDPFLELRGVKVPWEGRPPAGACFIRARLRVRPVRRDAIDRVLERTREEGVLDALFRLFVGAVAPEMEESDWAVSDPFEP